VRATLALVVVVGAAAALGPGTPSARASSECRGLLVCVKVAGPWIVVPARLDAPRARVEYRLSCPRGFIVGGLDAELSDRAIDVAFLGRLGSPVAAGVTTDRAVVFAGTYTGGAPRAPTFRPHLGCVPAAGGGTGPVPYAVFPPGEPTVRRVANVALRPARSVRVVRACGAGERVVSGWDAVGFYTAAPPRAELVAAVAASRTVRSDRVEARVRTTEALRGVRAVIQVGAVCGGGP
jgi:hypothetical protein